MKDNAQAMELLTKTVIAYADIIKEDDVKRMLASVGIDYEEAKAKYQSK